MELILKKNTLIIPMMLIIGSLLLFACQPSPRVTPVETGFDPSQMPQGGQIKVLAVESFLANIAQNVAGDRVQIETLIPPGMDPHAFEPSPQDIAKISESQVLIVNGAGFEEWLTKTLEEAGGTRSVIEASTGLTSRETREGEEAVISAEEKAAQVCQELIDYSAKEEIAAGIDAVNAAELPGESEDSYEEDSEELKADLFKLTLNPAEGGYEGFILFNAPGDGEYIIAANGGELSVTDLDGVAMDVEDTLPVNCAGLDDGILLDLEPGKYRIALRNLSEEMTNFFIGSAGWHHDHDGDPHFWLDPNNVIKYVENIREALDAADPSGKDVYNQNAAAYITQLTDLDAWIKLQVSAIPEDRRLIVTNHESFGYFADRYGFQIIGTIIPSVSTGAAPSAQQMARLVDRIRETGATAIFLETGSNPQLAEQIATETGIRVVSELFTHAITDASGIAPTYLDMIKYNVQTIVEALK